MPAPDADIGRQRQVVDAFFAAARGGDFDRLVQVLDPDVVLVGDFGPGRRPMVVRGLPAVSKMARAPRGSDLHRALVNGAPGAVVTLNGRPFSVMAFTVVDDKIVEIEVIADPERVAKIASAVLP